MNSNNTFAYSSSSLTATTKFFELKPIMEIFKPPHFLLSNYELPVLSFFFNFQFFDLQLECFQSFHELNLTKIHEPVTISFCSGWRISVVWNDRSFLASLQCEINMFFVWSWMSLAWLECLVHCLMPEKENKFMGLVLRWVCCVPVRYIWIMQLWKCTINAVQRVLSLEFRLKLFWFVGIIVFGRWLAFGVLLLN